MTDTGTFRPQGGTGGLGESTKISNLAGFNSSDANGTWNLRVYNFGATDGTLGSSSLEVIPVRFKFSPTFALGAVGLWLLFKAKQKFANSKQ